LETKTQAPSFTVSLRGYDREEVDEYLDSLAEALAQVEEAEEHSRRLQAHVARCNSRIKELEDKIRADTPKTGVALGERIGLLLHEAEDAASDVIARAEADATRTVAAAEARAAEAEELMQSATARAEDQARRIETVAKGEAAEIVAEAEARAAARTRQIEQWAEQVISHTRAEEARMFVEQQKAKDAAASELRTLAEQRRSATATLLNVREAIGRAVGLIEDNEEPTNDAEVSASEEAESDTAEGLPTGGHAAADMPEAEQLEAKLDAWVAGAPENS
jgi:DivIVA domain-containing protein